MTREEIIAWCRQQYDTEPDYPWNDKNAVLRHKNTGNTKQSDNGGMNPPNEKEGKAAFGSMVLHILHIGSISYLLNIIQKLFIALQHLLQYFP